MGSSASIENLKKEDDSSPPTVLLNRADRKSSSMGFLSSSLVKGFRSGDVRTDDVRCYKLEINLNTYNNRDFLFLL